MKPVKIFGNKNKAWKGDRASYSAIHHWMKNNFGKPNKCEKCNIKNPKRYEWANLSGKYKRVRSDWLMLCTSCHKKMDYGNPENCLCGNKYFSKGKCKKHYYQEYYLKNKL